VLTKAREREIHEAQVKERNEAFRANTARSDIRFSEDNIYILLCVVLPPSCERLIIRRMRRRMMKRRGVCH
jgi:hypothetical protein